MIGQLFQTIFVEPIVNLLVFIYRILASFHISGALGLAIVLLSVIVRIVVWPFIATQLKHAKKMAELKPQLDALKKKHGEDKMAFAQAQQNLFKERGVNPAAGCLPALIQLPVVWALLQAISAFLNTGSLDKINQMLYFPSWHFTTLPDLHFLGFDLTTKPATFSQGQYYLLLVPIITVLLQFIQSRMMAPSTPLEEFKTDSKKEKEEKEDFEDSMSAMQSQMSYMMPLMVGFFAFQFPIGVALYWNVFSLLGILQQYLLSGWGGLTDFVNLFKGKLFA